MIATLSPTPRTTLHRRPARGTFDFATIAAILDEAISCHVGFVADGQPYVIPTVHARIDDWLYLHGAAAGRMLRTVGAGVPVCVTVTLLDGLVLARSAFHHSVNYRSVVILGTATEVTAPEDKRAALLAIVEHVVPGRAADVRGPNDKELRATSVLRLPIVEASAKVRTGPPLDDEEDLAEPCWAGVVPLRLTPGTPLADAALPAGVAVPAYVRDYERPSAAMSARS